MAEEETSCTLYLGNLDPVKTTRRMLYEIGIQAGPVLSVSLPSDGARNKGFGFVEYEAHEDAAYAVSLFQGNLRLFDRQLRVDFGGKAAGASSGGAARGTPLSRAPSVGGTPNNQATPNGAVVNGSHPRHEWQQQQQQQQVSDLRQQHAEHATLPQQQALAQQHMVQQTQAYAGMLAQQQALAAVQLQQQAMAAPVYVQPQAYGAMPAYASPLQQQQQQQHPQQPFYTHPPQ